jgi:hypothetical protein
MYAQHRAARVLAALATATVVAVIGAVPASGAGSVIVFVLAVLLSAALFLARSRADAPTVGLPEPVQPAVPPA